MDNCDISTAYTSKNWKRSVKNREFHLKHILLYSINNTIANTKPLKMMTSTGLVANNSLPPCLSPFFFHFSLYFYTHFTLCQGHASKKNSMINVTMDSSAVFTVRVNVSVDETVNAQPESFTVSTPAASLWVVPFSLPSSLHESRSIRGERQKNRLLFGQFSLEMKWLRPFRALMRSEKPASPLLSVPSGLPCWICCPNVFRLCLLNQRCSLLQEKLLCHPLHSAASFVKLTAAEQGAKGLTLGLQNSG